MEKFLSGFGYFGPFLPVRPVFRLCCACVACVSHSNRVLCHFRGYFRVGFGLSDKIRLGLWGNLYRDSPISPHFRPGVMRFACVSPVLPLFRMFRDFGAISVAISASDFGRSGKHSIIDTGGFLSEFGDFPRSPCVSCVSPVVRL